jgi:hypothetical protein
MAEYTNRPFNLIDNYIYLFHTDEYLLIPTYPDTIQDSMTTRFSETNALSRSAPVFAFSNAGPRTVQISLNLHRDMMEAINYNTSNMNIEDIDDDYVDTLIKKLQSISVPKYVASSKSVQPPMIAVRFGNEIFIKGIVNGSITVTYEKPILTNNKYAQVQVVFTVTEVDPYDAESIQQYGSFRGLTRTFKNGIYSSND